MGFNLNTLLMTNTRLLYHLGYNPEAITRWGCFLGMLGLMLVCLSGCTPEKHPKKHHVTEALQTLKPSTRLHVSITDPAKTERLALSTHQWLTLHFVPSSEAPGVFIPTVHHEIQNQPSQPLQVQQTWTMEATAVPWVNIDVVRMNPRTPEASTLVLQSFSGGTHCCNHVKIAPVTLKPSQSWQTTDLGLTDGTPALVIDADKDGFFELPLSNDAYLYTFDAYVSSLAPPELWAVRQPTGIPEEVTLESRYSSWLKAQLDAYLKTITLPEKEWSNGIWAGYLGWQALISVRAYHESWQIMEQYYHKTQQYCPTLEKPAESCDEALKPLPEVLAPFIKTQPHVAGL
jgi:hypothetical protein